MFDAVAQMRRGLALLEPLTASSAQESKQKLDRDRQRLGARLLLALGQALQNVVGHVNAESTDAFSRAQTLGEALEDPALIFQAVGSLNGVYIASGKFERALGTAILLKELMQQLPVPGFQFIGHLCLAMVGYHSGDLGEARSRLETRHGAQEGFVITFLVGRDSKNAACSSYSLRRDSRFQIRVRACRGRRADHLPCWRIHRTWRGRTGGYEMIGRIQGLGVGLAIALSIVLASGDVDARGGRGGGGGGRGGGGGGGFSQRSPAAGGSFSSQRAGGSRSRSGSSSMGGSSFGGASSRQSGASSRAQQPRTQQPRAQQPQARQQPAGGQANRSQNVGDNRSDRQQNAKDNQSDRESNRTENREDWQNHQKNMQNDRQEFYEDNAHHHYYGGPGVYYGNHYNTSDFAAGVAAGFIIGTTLSIAAANSLSSSCTMTSVPVSGATFYSCGPNWYQKAYSGGEVTYIVVAPPPGY